MRGTKADLLRRGSLHLRADPSRVIARLFVPGQEGFEHRESRAAAVLDRLDALDDDVADAAMADIDARFAGRHRDLAATFDRHAEQLADRMTARPAMTPNRRRLVGATFTSEYAIQGAAFCNPSLVAHPEQAGSSTGDLRVVMSGRAIGEGHRSSIEFRTGVVDATGELSIDPPSPFATTGESGPAPLDGDALRREVEGRDGSGENADYVLDALGETYDHVALEHRLEELLDHQATRRDAPRVAELLREAARRTYGVRFDEVTDLSERVLWPSMAAESHGMEDARFVQFREDDGSTLHRATYTAYDGVDISLQLLETTDFLNFTSTPLVGAAAANKGLALFPRRIAGRYAALSRWDRERNSIAFSDNVRRWDDAVPWQAPAEPWEILQLGNCGSPIETSAGWLVLTHGVGPMRTYSIGAVLLDLEDPTRVLGRLREPLLRPAPDERDGYVPNVVYSCGGLVHAGTLVVPFGTADAAIGVATVPLDELLAALTAA